MEEILREEQQEQKENFIVDSDEKAEWAIKKIKEEIEERDRLIDVCMSMINEYKDKMSDINERCDKDTSFLRSQLQQYMESVKTKKLKASEVYTLPSGKLRKKFLPPVVKTNEEELSIWLRENQKQQFIKKSVKEQIMWSDLKKTLHIDADKGIAVDSDGVVVAGLTITQQDPTFNIE